MKLSKVTTNGRVTIPVCHPERSRRMRNNYGLYPGRKVKLEADDIGIKIIPLVTMEEVEENIGFLRTTSQRPGKKGKLLKVLMEEKRLEKKF